VRDDNLTTLAGPVSNLILVLLAFCGLAILSVVIPNGRDIVQSSFIAALNPGMPLTMQPVPCSSAWLS